MGIISDVREAVTRHNPFVTVEGFEDTVKKLILMDDGTRPKGSTAHTLNRSAIWTAAMKGNSPFSAVRKTKDPELLRELICAEVSRSADFFVSPLNWDGIYQTAFELKRVLQKAHGGGATMSEDKAIFQMYKAVEALANGGLDVKAIGVLRTIINICMQQLDDRIYSKQ